MLAYDDMTAHLRPLETFCVIFACAIHDVGHAGVNNDFLVKTQHEWAMVYNDTSVNENMHVRVAFEILQDPACNIFESAPPSAHAALPAAALWPMGIEIDGAHEIRKATAGKLHDSSRGHCTHKGMSPLAPRLTFGRRAQSFRSRTIDSFARRSRILS